VQLASSQHDATSVWTDLGILRRYFWLPVFAVVLAVLAALAFGAIVTDDEEARFRANVVVDALPPLFGPAVLPGPFDYAALATSEDVIGDVAAATASDAAAIGPRLKAEPRVDTPEISFSVTGQDALSLARAWETAFTSAVESETQAIQARLVESYREQLAQAQSQLEVASAASAADPGNVVLQQELTAAEDNFATAARLVQSYDVVTETMTARSFTSKAPYSVEGGLGSPAARIAAAVCIGLLAGVLGALGLEWTSRRREQDVRPPRALRHDAVDPEPARSTRR
jgi:hypothetical protein